MTLLEMLVASVNYRNYSRVPQSIASLMPEFGDNATNNAQEKYISEIQ